MGELYLIGKINTPIVPLSKDKKIKPADVTPTEVGILPLNSQPGNLKPIKPEPVAPAPDKIVPITDGNFIDGGDTTTPAPTLDLTNKSNTLKNILIDYTNANGGDYNKTYNELVRQLKENSNNEEFVKNTINRLLNTLDDQYDKNDPATFLNYKKIANTNVDVLKTYMTTPDSEYIPHALCGSIHEFGMKLLKDAGYDAGVIAGNVLKQDDTGDHYTLLYKMKDKEYIYNNYGDSVKVYADNMLDAAKRVMSSYENGFTTKGNISIQGAGKGETFIKYYAQDEALFGEKIDKNTNTNILKVNKDVESFAKFDNADKKFHPEDKKTIIYGAEKNINHQLVNFSLKNENNGIENNIQKQFNVQVGTKNTSSKYYDKANDKAIDAKYQLQKNNKQFSAEVIGSDLNLEKTTQTVNSIGIIVKMTNKDPNSLSPTGKGITNTIVRKEFVENNKLTNNIQTLSTNVGFKKFYPIKTYNDDLKVTSWVGAGLNAYGTRVKSSISNNGEKFSNLTYCGDGRLSLTAGANAQYKIGNLNTNATASFQQIGDAAFNNASEQLPMLKQGNIKEVSFGADYKIGQNTIYGNAQYASLNSKNLYNKTILNTTAGFNTQNIANSGINVNAYAGYEQNSANLNMSSVKENIENEKRYYIGTIAEKQTKFGSIKAGLQYDKYLEGFKEGKNKGLSANVSLIYKF